MITIDLSFVIDVTGSMLQYTDSTIELLKILLDGNNSPISNLNVKMPGTSFHVRIATLRFRDIDDRDDQFKESIWDDCNHFTENIDSAFNFSQSLLKGSSGGGDLEEDVIGAIHHSINWNLENDWTSKFKFIMLFIDAPSHGIISPSLTEYFSENYPTRHPSGLTSETVIDNLVMTDIDRFMCSFNSIETSFSEKTLSDIYKKNPDNKEERDITKISMIERINDTHIIFVLDNSSSMVDEWSGVVSECI